MPLLQRIEAAQQFDAVVARALDELLVFEHLQRGEAGGHREVVASEGRGMHDAAIEPEIGRASCRERV